MDDHLQSKYHHEQCPVCGQRFLGFTDADKIEHFVAEHEDYGKKVATKLGLSSRDVVVCENCEREYVTYMGECPWCQHGDPPYT